MASTLRDWILQRVESQLSTAFEALKSQYTSGQQFEQYPYSCGKESLSIHLTKGKRVQVVEVLDHSPHLNDFDVVLSDATTKIRATLTSTATTGFSSIRDVEDTVLGAVLGIEDYYLDYRPNLSLSEQLALRVTKFKVCGCVGANPFGRPVNIEEHDILLEVLSKVDRLLSEHQALEPEQEFDIQSQAGDMNDSDNSPRATNSQTLFATQAPLLAIGPKKQPHSKTQLLDLLLPQPPTSTKTVNMQVALQPVSESRKAGMSSRLDSKANSQSSLQSSCSKENTLFLSNARTNVEDDSGKENSQERLDEETAPMTSTLNTESRGDAIALELEPHSSVAPPITEPNPFEGMERVPRSYVRIQENQQALLDRVDSWYRPNAGSRSSYANLPAEVLQDLKAHEDRIQQNLILDGVARQKPDGNAGNDSAEEESYDEADDEEDAEVSTGTQQKECGIGDLAEVPSDDILEIDEDLVSSWSLSDHGKVEEPIQDLHLPPLCGGLRSEAAKYGAISVDKHLASAPSSSPKASIVEQNPPLKLNTHIEYNFPSSSPGCEDELEIAVPYTIDDEILADDQDMADGPSQELPSTAVQNKVVVQVEQTPDHHARGTHFPNKRAATALKFQYSQTNEIMLSDQIIPGTFHDTSSQTRSRSSGRFQTTSSHLSSHSQTSKNKEKPDLLKHDISNDFQNLEDEEDANAEDQLVTELRTSQREGRHLPESSPIVPTLSDREALRSPTPVRYRKPSFSHHLSPKPAPSSFHPASSDIRSEDFFDYTTDISLEKLRFSKRGGEMARLSDRALRHIVAVPASQGAGDFVRTEDLAKRQRQMFNAQYFPRVEDAPVVQIAQSQRPTSEAKRPSAIQIVADGTPLQSSGDFVQSSVLEKKEGSTAVEQAREEPINETSREHERCLSHDGANSATPISHNFSAPEAQKNASEENMGPAISIDPKADVWDVIEDFAEDPAMKADEIVSVSSDSDSTSEADIVQGEEGVDGVEGVEGEELDESVPEDQEISQSMGTPRERCSSPELERLNVDSATIAVRPSGRVRNPMSCPREYAENAIALRDAERKVTRSQDDSLSNDHGYAQNRRHVSEEHRIGSPQKLHQHFESPKPTAYDRFIFVYPDYTGNENRFAQALVYIDWLLENRGDEFLRASLWDDFIRTQADEYMKYIREAREKRLPTATVKTGFAYFNKLDKDPVFRDRIIMPHNLPESISSLDGKLVEAARSSFNRSPATATGTSTPLSESIRVTSPGMSDLQVHQTKRKNHASTPEETATRSQPRNIPRPISPEPPARSALKRPFFETASQLQDGKRARISVSPPARDLIVDTLSTSKKTRILPCKAGRSPISPNELRSAARSPSASSRHPSQASNPRRIRGVSSPIQFTGSPRSPILGQRASASHSFSSFSSFDPITHTPLPNKSKITPSVPRTSTSAQRRTSLPLPRKAKIEDHRPSPLNPRNSLPAGALKRMRESGLETLEHSPADVGVVGVTRPRASPAPVSASTPERATIIARPEALSRLFGARSAMAGPSVASTPAASSSSTTLQRLLRPKDFKEFLALKRRQREKGEDSSIPRAGSAKKEPKLNTVEPETQAWS